MGLVNFALLPLILRRYKLYQSAIIRYAVNLGLQRKAGSMKSEANRQSDTAEKSQNETTENATVAGAESGRITKRKKHRFLKAELVVLVCVICIWVVKSVTIDIESAEGKDDWVTISGGGEYDRAISLNNKAIEIDPRDAYEETGQVSYVPEQQQVVIDQQLLQILQARSATIRKDLHARWRIEAEALGKSWFSNRGQYDTAVANLNAKYQMKELEARQAIDAQIREIQQIQKLINDNKMSIHAGNEAVWRLVFPRETKAVFPMREIFRPVGYKDNCKGSK